MPELFNVTISYRTRIVRYVWRFMVASLLLFGIAGCGAALEVPTPQMRVVHASLRAGTLDVQAAQGDAEASTIAYRIRFGTVTTYFPATAGVYAFTASDSRYEEARTNVHFGEAGHYTVVLRDTVHGVFAETLSDHDRPAPAGQVSLRVLRDAQSSNAPDLYLVPLSSEHLRTVLLPAVATGASSAYVSVPPGVYMLYAMAPGVPLHAAAPLYSGPAVHYPSGAARTLLLVQAGDGQPTMTALILRDYEPTGVSQPAAKES